MIVYAENKKTFIDHVRHNRIEEEILLRFHRVLNRSVGLNEIRSWQNSLIYMGNALSDTDIPDDAGVALEYSIPQTSKRIDFLLSGTDAKKNPAVVIVELKQWEKVGATDKNGVVTTYLGGDVRETTHPSYQAWSYASLLQDFNESVTNYGIALYPCAYLHNCRDGNGILDDFYGDDLQKSPAFLRDDVRKLQDFMTRYIRHGDSNNILYTLEHGRIRPSKALADHLVTLLHGNSAFIMIDDQKTVYEQALSLGRKTKPGEKSVLLVEGGPGTGKSVVAVNLLVEFTRQGKLVQYVSKNAAPRAVFEAMLSKEFKKSRISNMFKGSGSYTESMSDDFDVLVVDEAHRLNEKSGMYQNLGEHQVKELIQAARTTIFFIDENQRISLKDIGEKKIIRDWANKCGAKVIEMKLASQFRCNGSDGYLAWLDSVLDIRETANITMNPKDYPISVAKSPIELRDWIIEMNSGNSRARMVAGYCWDWVSKKDKSKIDIDLGNGFQYQWNLETDGSLWILKESSIHQIGCIHTCQGLELEYIGVIIGPDLIVRNNKLITQPGKRSSQDRTLRGWKKLSTYDPNEAQARGDMIIKNTYRTLMTRGMRGCMVYSEDKETRDYFSRRIIQ